MILMHNIVRVTHSYQTKGYAMFFGTPPANPWDEDPAKPSKVAAIHLLALARFVEKNAAFCKANGFSTLADNARALAVLVQESRDVYTNHRRLFVVRIPELQLALETMLKLPPGEDIAPLKDQITVACRELELIVGLQSEIKRAATIEKATVGLEVSRTLPLPPAKEPVAAYRGGLFGKMNSDTLSRAVQAIRDSSADLAAQSVFAAKYVAVLGKHTLADGVSIVTIPVQARITALQSAIEEGVSVAIIGGLVVGVLFPPALPLAVWYAYLSAGKEYSAALDDSLSQAEQERKLRERGASEEVARALAAVRGQKVIRLESEHVMAEVDLKTNQMDGTILSGRYSGSRLSELDVETIRLLHRKAPDRDTKKLLIQYLDSKQT
jgi:hypothetical protein